MAHEHDEHQTDHDHGHQRHGGHGGHGGHGHSHAPRIDSSSAGERYRKPLTSALALTVAFLVVQVIVGVATGSLAVLSDAGHMATDSLGLAMSLAAIVIASRSTTTGSRTFGTYRLEILAALANAILLFGVAGYVLFEAATRLGDPPEIASLPVLVIGVVGLVVNLASFALLRTGAKESLNIEGAALEVVSDALGSVGVIVGAAIMWVTGWGWVDPLIGAAIGLFILPRAWRLGREAIRVLLQAAPAGLDPDSIATDLASIEGVESVHDLHLWTLTSQMDVVTAHLAVSATVDREAVLARAQEVLERDHGLTHATLQVEHVAKGCSHPDW